MIDIDKLFKRSLELYFAYSFPEKYSTVNTADFYRIMSAVKKAIAEQEDDFDIIEAIKEDMYKRMV